MNLSFISAVLLGFLFSAFFSGVETGGYTLNRIRLRRRTLEKKPAAQILSNVLRKPLLFIFSVLIGNNIAVYFLSKTVTDHYLQNGLHTQQMLWGFFPWNAEMAATLTLTFPLFIFAELAPKNYFRKKANHLMYRFAWLLQLLVWATSPLTVPLQKLFRLLVRNTPGGDVNHELHRLSAEGLKDYFSDSAREGVLSPDQSRMLDNVVSMHSVPLRMLMTPLRKTPSLTPDATVADFKQIAQQRQTDTVLIIDKHHVIGSVSIFHIINRRLNDSQPLTPCIEEVLQLQSHRNLKSAFYRLRRHPRHSAVVIDARNHPIGYISLDAIARYIAGKESL